MIVKRRVFLGNYTFLQFAVDNLTNMLLTTCDWCAASQDRLWRKTRSRNPDAQVTCRGVDSNRNWSFHWNGSNSQQTALLTFTLQCSIMKNVTPTDAGATADS